MIRVQHVKYTLIYLPNTPLSHKPLSGITKKHVNRKHVLLSSHTGHIYFYSVYVSMIQKMPPMKKWVADINSDLIILFCLDFNR